MSSADISLYKTTTLDPQGRVVERFGAVEARLRDLERAKMDTLAPQTIYDEDLAEISTSGGPHASHTPSVDVNISAGQVVSIYFQCEMKASVGSCTGGAWLTATPSYPLPGASTQYLILKSPATSYSGNAWANAPATQGVSTDGSSGLGAAWFAVAEATGDFTFQLNYGHISGAAGTNYWKNRKLWVEVR